MNNDNENEEQTQGPFSAYGLAYFRAGFQPIPVKGKAIDIPKGITGHKGRLLTMADVMDYAIERPDDNVALRANGWVGIDVDNYKKDGVEKRGWITLQLAEERWGKLPPTWISTARPGQSGIRFYRVPEGDLNLVTQLKMGDEDGETFGDIEIIQWSHRYAVVAPSHHPFVGRPYFWRFDGRSGDIEPPELDLLPELPAAWLEGLRSTGRENIERDPIEVAPQRADADKWRPEVVEAYKEGLDATEGPAGSRHDSVGVVLGKLARYEERGYAGSTTAMEALHDTFVRVIDDPGRDAGPEFDRMVDHSRRQAASTQSTIALLDLERRRVEQVFANVAVSSKGSGGNAHSIGPSLPAEFWAARETHQLVRQAAHSRGISGDALMGLVLARISASLAPLWRVAPIVGAPAALSTYVSLVGAPGTGKSVALGAARELVPIDPDSEIGVGSGEGLIEAYHDWVAGEEGEPKHKEQTRKSMFATLDEGTALSEMASRQGNTTLSIIRQMWNGGPVGQANATEERNRKLRDGSYVLGLAIGIQPEKTGPLFDDAGAGTPQRFLWLSATDPSLPDHTEAPEWPGGPLGFTPPTRTAGDQKAGSVTFNEFGFDVDKAIIDEVRGNHFAKGRGDVVEPELEAHGMLKRLKVAHLLALLENRRIVTPDDWRLATMVVDTSNAVMRHCQDVLTAEAASREGAAVERHARRAKATIEATVDQQVELLDRMARKARRKIDETTMACRTDLNRAIGGKALKRLGTDDDLGAVLDYAIGEGWILDLGKVENRQSFVAGPAAPK